MSRKREPQPREASTTDLFGWMDAIWTKAKPEGTAPTYMMHRFLASDRDFAQVARTLQMQVREPNLIFAVWQALLPKGRSAPRLQYVVAKKPPAEEALVTRMREVLHESRGTVESIIAIVRLAGREQALYDEFGIINDE